MTRDHLSAERSVLRVEMAELGASPRAEITEVESELTGRMDALEVGFQRQLRRRTLFILAVLSALMTLYNFI